MILCKKETGVAGFMAIPLLPPYLWHSMTTRNNSKKEIILSSQPSVVALLGAPYTSSGLTILNK